MRCHFREQRGRDGARLRGCCENHGGSTGEKKAGNFIDGLVAHGSVDQVNIPAGEELFPEDGDFTCAGGIVCPVNVNFRLLADAFEAAGPYRLSEAARNGLVVDGRAAFGEQSRRGKSRQRIADLKAAGEPQSDGDTNAGIVGNRGERKATVANGHIFEIKSVLDFHEEGRLLRAAAPDDHAGDEVFGGADHARARLDNSRFFRGDFFDRVAGPR
jgi:hypothetical protein